MTELDSDEIESLYEDWEIDEDDIQELCDDWYIDQDTIEIDCIEDDDTDWFYRSSIDSEVNDNDTDTDKSKDNHTITTWDNSWVWWCFGFLVMIFIIWGLISIWWWVLGSFWIIWLIIYLLLILR